MLTNSASLPNQCATWHIGKSHLSVGSNEASDDDLIKDIAGGDRAAMQALYGRLRVKVYRFALRFVGNEATAEDVVSETFFDVWRQAGTFNGTSQVSTWLLAIARHKALAMLRRRPTEPIDNETLSIVDTADDPETSLHKKQRRSIMIDCLAKLSPTHREIIDLVYYHQKTIDEVAVIIQIPRNTVKTRMFYARQKLAELLIADGNLPHSGPRACLM